MTEQTPEFWRAEEFDTYFRDGQRRALALDNRGPLRFVDGTLDPAIVESYSRHGFYIFEGVLDGDELDDLGTELEALLERAPVSKGVKVDAQGRPAFDTQFQTPMFQMVRPLSDPVGGTDLSNGRHPARMSEYLPPADAPEHVVYMIAGMLHATDACLRLYGHPQLLAVAEAINGADFTPFGDSIWIKEPGLGASVAWHQDGTTHWGNPDLDEGTHGFNFMAQLLPTTPENALWVVPGTHKDGKIDIKALVDAHGSDRLPDAVPMLCAAGDVAICNRQVLHGSFANTSPDRRVTFVFGFHRLKSVRDLRLRRGGREIVYDDAWIHERSRLIPLAIDARHQRFPDEVPYRYAPLAGEEDAYRWSEETRETILKDYNLKNIGI